MTFTAEFRCIAGCAGGYALDEVIYRCPKCSELLEVVHDLEALRTRSADDWKALFGARWRQVEEPFGSGVWGKHEWVAPQLESQHIVSMLEGGTHLTRVPRFAAALGLGDVRVKQCGTSHSGSFKDLGMTVLVSSVAQMIARGRPIRAIACASTGDTSAALAAYAAAANIRAVVILPRGKISTAQLVQPLAAGALVLAVDTDFDGCMRLVQDLADREGVYLANSMNSLRLEGQKTVAIEIAQQLGWQVPDWVVIPGGNLGNVSALGAGFDMLYHLGLVDRRPRICVAQAAHASPLHASYTNQWADLAPVKAKTTLASAIQIGNPVSFKKAVRALRAFDGVVEVATEAELADASASADRDGLFTCPHTGVALAALTKLARRGDITRDDRVVVISTASGLKFADFKVGYHEARLADVAAPVHRNVPLELPERYDAVRDALVRGLG
ncbi:MAG: threonine synthase [Deltaproteobacteria bacterium]|nr:threonine synthase [Deltaproteobacteria bacterium]MDQ3300323.1 threonine synthase [Myxococcota bacterium]